MQNLLTLLYGFALFLSFVELSCLPATLQVFLTELGLGMKLFSQVLIFVIFMKLLRGLSEFLVMYCTYDCFSGHPFI